MNISPGWLLLSAQYVKQFEHRSPIGSQADYNEVNNKGKIFCEKQISWKRLKKSITKINKVGFSYNL